MTLDGSGILGRAPRVQALLARLRESNVPLDQAFLVGGAVRDAVLGRDAGPDVDIAVVGDGIAFGRDLAAALGGRLSSEHAFGTSRVVVPLPQPWSELQVDVASSRTETYTEPGALPTVELGAGIDADLARRDVTVNAVAVALAADASGSHAVVDPFGGLADLRARLLRVLHDESFVDDPTRVWRVARYAGRTGLRVEEHTRALAIGAVRDGALATISADRLATELRLVLQEPAWESLTLLASWGVLEQLDPRLDGAFRPPMLLRLLDEACGDDPDRNRRAWPLRLATLALPLGDDAGGWLRWLGMPGEVSESVLGHLRLLRAALERGDELRGMTASQLYLELGDVEDESLALVALAVADRDPALVEQLVGFAATTRSTRLTVRGDDVIAAGVPAGPRVGRILGDLFLRSLDGELRGEGDERRALAEHAGQQGQR